MSADVWATPRPVPSRVLPAAAGTAVIVLALPVFAIAGWPIDGWALAAVLWAAGEMLHALLTRLRSDDGNLAAASVVGVGTTFRAMAVGIPLVAVTAADEAVGLWAALLYTLAFTLELALALVIYFGQEPKRL